MAHRSLAPPEYLRKSIGFMDSIVKVFWWSRIRLGAPAKGRLSRLRTATGRQCAVHQMPHGVAVLTEWQMPHGVADASRSGRCLTERPTSSPQGLALLRRPGGT